MRRRIEKPDPRSCSRIEVPGFVACVAVAIALQVGALIVETSANVLPFDPRLVPAYLAATTIFTATGIRRRHISAPHFLGILLVWIGSLALFIPFIAAIEVPLRARLLTLAAILAHGVAGAILILWLVRISRLVESGLIVGGIAVGMFIAELTLESGMGDLLEIGPLLDGPIVGDDELGMIFPPYAEHRAYYPDDPRGYFQIENLVREPWRLRAIHANAELAYDEIDSSRVHVRIHEGDLSEQSGIHLIRVGLPVVAGREYQLSFQAQADLPRRIAYSVGSSFNPLDGPGVYVHGFADLTPEPQSFSTTFVAEGTSHNAHLKFDPGVGPGSLSLTDVTLAQIPEMRPVEPALIERPFVQYNFNAFGCRGPDYEIPRPEDTWRILMLGDSYVLGLGVHEDDTISRRIERKLNEMAAAAGTVRRYEVINCGVSGFSTRDERLLFERLTDYNPHVVIVGMVANDDRSWVDEVRDGHVYLPNRADHISGMWSLIRRWRSSSPPASFDGSLQEIMLLDERVRAQGGRLAVFAFRNFDFDEPGARGWRRAWTDLVETMRAGLKNTGIPFIDAGEVMLAEHTEKELVVHRLDVHPNEIGHALAAEAVWQMLRESGFLPFQETILPDTE